jgi:hypothetical protein
MTADDDHTLDELYEYRLLYNAAFFNTMEHNPDWGFGEYKSLRHGDGKLCFGGGWFIVVAMLPTGLISNHYALADWDLFKIEERPMVTYYDNHTSAQVAERLRRYLKGEQDV